MNKREKYLSLLKSMKNEWVWLFHYVKRYRLWIFIYLILGLIATVMSLFTSVASKNLIDAVVEKSKHKLTDSIAIVIALAVFQILFTALSSWIQANVSVKTTNEIRSDIFSKVVLSHWQNISKYHSGELLNIMEGDVSAVASGVITFVPNLFIRSVQFFGSLAIVLYYDKTMAFLALLSAPILFFSSRFLIKTMRKYNKETREVNGNVLSFSEESLQNLQVIKAFDLTKRYINNFKDVLGIYKKVRLNYEKFSIFITLTLSFIGLVVSYACYGWGVYRFWQNSISYGTMTLFLMISGTLTSSFSSLASLAPSAVSIATSAGRIMNISQINQEEDKDKEKVLAFKSKVHGNGFEIVSDNVSFRYEDSDSDVIKNMNFSFKTGETVAFIGPSGQGKTTVLKLLLGLIYPLEGNLYLKSFDGECVEISDSTRKLFSYVPQDKSMFTASIADNLRLGKYDASENEIENVLKKAEIYDFVENLPNKTNTEIGENGTNLSHGQAQRIAIARALLKDAEIVILDEATSALDIDTESKLLNNIMHDNNNRICIITSHRKSMLKYCDKIYKVSPDGCVNLIEDKDENC